MDHRALTYSPDTLYLNTQTPESLPSSMQLLDLQWIVSFVLPVYNHNTNERFNG